MTRLDTFCGMKRVSIRLRGEVEARGREEREKREGGREGSWDVDVLERSKTNGRDDGMFEDKTSRRVEWHRTEDVITRRSKR